MTDALHQATPPFIASLLATSTPWTAPVAVPLDNPSWAKAWATSDNIGKINIARGWTWSALTYEDFAKAVDNNLSWVQQIRPYLDASFFAPYLHDAEWAYAATMLGFEDFDVVPEVLADQDLSASRVVSSLLFGGLEEQSRTLLNLPEDGIQMFWGFVQSAVKTAWAIAGDATGEIYQAAKTLTIGAGEYRELPSENIPKRAQLYQYYGYFTKNAINLDEDGLTALKTFHGRLVQEDPVFAADLLAPALETFVDEDENNEYYLRMTCFLAYCVEDYEPYAALKKWIPLRTEFFDNAQLVGMHPGQACRIIAEEKNLKASPHSLALPQNITNIDI